MTDIATIANQIATRHANVISSFDALTLSAIAGRIDQANAEVQAKALGDIRSDLETQMDAVLRIASAQLAEILMPSIRAHAAVLA